MEPYVTCTYTLLYFRNFIINEEIKPLFLIDSFPIAQAFFYNIVVNH